MSEIEDQIRAEIARQIAPLREALETIGAQMQAHNAAVQGAEPAGAGWFPQRGRPDPGGASGAGSDQLGVEEHQALMQHQIQRLAEDRLRAKEAAITEKMARMRHRIAARTA